MAITRDIVVIGASAGGVEALQEVVTHVPPDLPAALFVVLHMPARYTSHLPSILSRAGPLPATTAIDGETIKPGRIYVAPPDFHLLVDTGRVLVARGPRVNRSRPAIDLLFQSASAAYGPRVTGIVLSGMLDDGTRGLAAIKRNGGYAVVQDPADATFPGMPQSAIDNVPVDEIVPAHAMGHALARITAESLTEDALMPQPPARRPADTPEDDEGQGEISAFTCPECGGTLWRVEDGTLVHFQCRVGHWFTPSNLLSAQVDEVEVLLWSALRAMEERESIYRHMLDRSKKFGKDFSVASIEKMLATNNEHAEMLRRILVGEESVPEQDVKQSAGN